MLASYFVLSHTDAATFLALNLFGSNQGIMKTLDAD